MIVTGASGEGEVDEGGDEPVRQRLWVKGKGQTRPVEFTDAPS